MIKTLNIKPTKEKIIHRMKITEGHFKKVRSMVEKGEYCIDILHQSQAVLASLKEINHLIMENHLNTCVVEAIKKGKSKEVISEVMSVVNKIQ
jgi:DNA-binding FrmR family transcriptional regulator